MPPTTSTPSRSTTTTITTLDTSLLRSSPPEGTELRQANSVLNSIVQNNKAIESLVKRYIAQVTTALEKSNSEVTLLWKQNAEQRELLETRKKRTTGKRVVLQGKFVFTTEEILEVVWKAEAETAKKKTRKRKRNASPTLELEDIIEDVPKQEDSDSEACVVPSNDHEHPENHLCLRQNLASALKHLRKADEARVLWVDAVCINQNELEEKAAQIKRMRHIYQLATTVVVWIGDGTDDSLMALNLLEHLGKQVEITTDGWAFPAVDPKASEPTWWDRSVALPYSTTEWQGIESLFLRPYFDRLWVLQEVIANPHTIFICGRDTIDWYYLRWAISMLDERVGVPAALSYSVNKKFQITSGCRTSLREVVYMARQHQCQDPQDKIYGMLDFFGPELKAKISPSYEKPVEELYYHWTP